MSIKIGSTYIAKTSNIQVDNNSITTNAITGHIQSEGIIDDNNTSNAIKTWTGTLAEYQAIVTKDNNTIYTITDDSTGGSSVYTKTEVDELLDDKADAITVYTKTETDTLLSSKANSSSVYTKSEVQSLLDLLSPTLFEIKNFDYIITDNNWKNPVDNSYYSSTNYPIAYNHLLTEYNAVKDIQQHLNGTITGTLTNNNFVYSGFSQSNYIILNETFKPGLAVWEFNTKISYTTSDIFQGIIHPVSSSASGGTAPGTIACFGGFVICINTSNQLQLSIGSSTAAWDIANGVTSTNLLNPNTYYFIRLKFTGTQYLLDVSTDNSTWVNYITVSSTSLIPERHYMLGCPGSNNNDPLRGNIDFKETYCSITNVITLFGILPGLMETIAGTNIIYYRATDGHKIIIPNQETQRNTILTNTNQAYYYLLDTANNRFKLPISKIFFEFNGNNNTIGNYIPESLPNIKGNFTSRPFDSSGGYGAICDNANGVFSYSAKGSSYTITGISAGSTSYNSDLLNFDASRSSSTYQDNAPVQPSSVKITYYMYIK